MSRLFLTTKLCPMVTLPILDPSIPSFISWARTSKVVLRFGAAPNVKDVPFPTKLSLSVVLPFITKLPSMVAAPDVSGPDVREPSTFRAPEKLLLGENTEKLWSGEGVEPRLAVFAFILAAKPLLRERPFPDTYPSDDTLKVTALAVG